MANTRGVFSSKLGFIMAASGSAVGLGNIWGFPTQTASNGGAAFVLVYLILAFCLAYPAFMAEIMIGRFGQANAVSSLQKISSSLKQKRFALITGLAGVICAALILSFYGIVAGWMVAHTLEPIMKLTGEQVSAQWLISFSFERNIIFTALFMLLTILIISKGVEQGIEKWSKRLMPIMFVLLLSLILYVVTQPGAEAGLSAYLKPDISRILEPQLLLSALGQAFFSLSLGTSVMIIYGSYIPKTANMVTLGAQVTLIDVSVAFLAGLLIIPAMYVAQAQGVEIFATNGSLLSEDTLVFTVLPSLFNHMGDIGLLIAFGFFALMSIAALTSSISMLEGPVSYAVERHTLTRQKASIIIGLIIFFVSIVIMVNFTELFGLVITLSTKYGQPIIAMLCCIFVGWIWQRNSLIKEIKLGNQEIESSFFWKVWPLYTKFICPVAIATLFINSF